MESSGSQQYFSRLQGRHGWFPKFPTGCAWTRTPGRDFYRGRSWVLHTREPDEGKSSIPGLHRKPGLCGWMLAHFIFNRASDLPKFDIQLAALKEHHPNHRCPFWLKIDGPGSRFTTTRNHPLFFNQINQKGHLGSQFQDFRCVPERSTSSVPTKPCRCCTSSSCMILEAYPRVWLELAKVPAQNEGLDRKVKRSALDEVCQLWYVTNFRRCSFSMRLVFLEPPVVGVPSRPSRLWALSRDARLRAKGVPTVPKEVFDGR